MEIPSETRELLLARLRTARALPWTSRGVEALLAALLPALRAQQYLLHEGAPDPTLAAVLCEIGDSHPGILVGLLQTLRGGFSDLPDEAPRGSALHSRVLEAERELASPSWGARPTIVAARTSLLALDPSWLVPVLRPCVRHGDAWLTILPLAVVSLLDSCVPELSWLHPNQLPHLATCTARDLSARPELATALGLWDEDTPLQEAVRLATEVHA